MKSFLSIISILWLTAGALFLIFPNKAKTLYAKLQDKLNLIKSLFILPLAAGVLFFWSSSISSLAPLIKLLGILSFVKGLFILLAPVNMLRSTFNFFLHRSETFWRLYGVFMIVLGSVVVWSVL